MQTEQANPAVVTIQDTILELEKLVELFKSFSPNETIQHLTDQQIQAIAKHLYEEAFMNRNITSLTGYIATAVRDLIFSEPQDDEPAEALSTREYFVNNLASRFANNSDFRYCMNDMVKRVYFDENSPYMEQFLEIATKKLMERLTNSSFTLTQVKHNKND